MTTKNTLSLSALPDAALPAVREEDTQAMIDRLTHELAARELDARFIEALERGKIQGDILIVDEFGQEVKNAMPPVTIFDVK